ncbi:MBL fold metallo-hydrolase [Candidatus Woesearchaeota archaeon]|nr:MBL fold metallo-hydrolase [Candidatus Woesearchaeota archaeon]
MVTIQFLGSAEEVGRSCILVNDKYLLDAGIKISQNGQEYPLINLIDPRQIQAVFLSHAHLDHTGALPLLNHNGLNCSIYCTKTTKKITKILLNDSIHIEMLSVKDPAYTEENITKIMSLMTIVDYNKQFKQGDLSCTFLDAGHIPGSSSILLEIDGKTILYTGDINTLTTRLTNGLHFHQQLKQKIDVMICESTYGDRDHKNRAETEARFLQIIKDTIKKGGKVIIPTFSVARAQELVIFLSKQNFMVPIYLDGMARKVTDTLLSDPDSINNSVALRKALKIVQYVKSYQHRIDITKEQGIFITTSGMVAGGPVLDYIKFLYNDPKTAILLTGFQAEGCNGRLLLDQQKAFIDGIGLAVKCSIEQFDFSAHAGKKELIQIITALKPKKVICNHGDKESCLALAKTVPKSVKAIVPKLGEIIEI